MYNPPPNWPTPPPGWEPPPGWRPDPSWPPAPTGHHFGVAELDGASLTETREFLQPLYRDAATASRPVFADPAYNSWPQPQSTPQGAAPGATAPKKRGVKWLAWAVPSLMLAVVLTFFGIFYYNSQIRGPGVAAKPVSTAPAAPPTTPSPTPDLERTPLPRTNPSPTPGTVKGGLSPDKTFSAYNGTGNADVKVVKLAKGPNLITFTYKGTGTFKAAQLNAEEENTRTLVNVKGGNHFGKYLLDLWVEDGETQQIRVKSTSGVWSFKIEHANEVQDISDVKTYEGKGNDVLYYPFSVRTDFVVKHPSDGAFVIALLNNGQYRTILDDQKEEFLAYDMYLKAKTFVIIESDGAWSMNPK